MHPRLHPVWPGLALVALLTITVLAVGTPTITASDPVIDVPTAYLPVVIRNHPPLFPPPLEAAMNGWLRKWRESEAPPRCLEIAGTPYYLETEPGAPSWAAAVAATELITEDDLELNIDHRVRIRGVIDYFHADCSFPRLYARELRVLPATADEPETKEMATEHEKSEGRN